MPKLRNEGDGIGFKGLRLMMGYGVRTLKVCKELQSIISSRYFMQIYYNFYIRRCHVCHYLSLGVGYLSVLLKVKVQMVHIYV